MHASWKLIEPTRQQLEFIFQEVMMDVIAILLDCGREAADAVSGYTQVTMEDAPRLLNIPMSECPDSWIRLSWTQMAQIFVRH